MPRGPQFLICVRFSFDFLKSAICYEALGRHLADCRTVWFGLLLARLSHFIVAQAAIAVGRPLWDAEGSGPAVRRHEAALASLQALVRVLVDGQVALERKEVGSWSTRAHLADAWRRWLTGSVTQRMSHSCTSRCCTALACQRSGR